MDDRRRTPTTAEPAVALEGVRKWFGDRPVVRGIDLAVPRGATYGLLGPNGAGKTTTIRMILDIFEPDAGAVRVFGRTPSPDTLHRIGYLPEERGLYPRMRVRRLLLFLAEIKGMPPARSKPRIDRWLDRLDLGDRAEARVQELSKGMQQKLQLIAALVHDPDIVILDEPFSGLDPLNQQVLQEIVTDLQRQGRTILFSTHLIEHAERICDHVCIIADGRPVLDGPVPDVRREHGGRYVAVGFDRWTPAARERLRQSPIVASMRRDGTEVELKLRPAGDPQELLEDLVAAGVRLRRFETVEASLEQIFVDRAGPAPSAAPEPREAGGVHV